MINNPVCLSLGLDDSGDDRRDCGGNGTPYIVIGITAMTAGLPLLGVGLARGRQRRRAFMWLRNRKVSLTPTASRSSVSRIGLSLSLVF